MVNGAACAAEGGKGSMGWKVRRKEASLLRCLTVKDIFKSFDEAVQYGGKGHGIIGGCVLGSMGSILILILQVLWPRLV